MLTAATAIHVQNSVPVAFGNVPPLPVSDPKNLRKVPLLLYLFAMAQPGQSAAIDLLISYLAYVTVANKRLSGLE
jgi:hypothetical protein